MTNQRLSKAARHDIRAGRRLRRLARRLNREIKPTQRRAIEHELKVAYQTKSLNEACLYAASGNPPVVHFDSHPDEYIPHR